MQSNQYIDKALLIEGDMLTVPEFIKATEYPIDAFMIDRFWHTMKKGMLIYVDADLITWMGYSNAEEAQRKQAFLRLLSLTKLNLGSDYFQYSNDEYSQFLTALVYTNVYTKIYPEVDISHGKGTTKHLLLTPKCLKTTMMKLSTARGDQVREYYIALEELFETYIGYQSDYKSRQITRELETKNNTIVLFQQQLAAKDKQLLIAENKNLAIQNYIANVKMLERDEYIYIATTVQYASSNQYKVGGAEKNLKNRLSSYNCGRADGDNFYYCWIYKCHDYRILEARIKSLLGSWRSNKNKEMYILNYNFLVKFIEFICQNDDGEVAIVNKFISAEYADSIICEPVIPPPITEFDGIIFALPEPQRVPLLDIAPHVEAPAAENTLPLVEEQVEHITHAPPAETNIESPIEMRVVIPLTVPATLNPGEGLIFTVQMQRCIIDSTVDTALQPYIQIGEVKKKELHGRIKSLLARGKKTKFKAREWAPLYTKRATELSIKIKK